ncbi:hypothetical protein PsYK624_073770 [Phanerochaete sordida]|uniref:RED-like N-terminal domain-containing protein n=1 Tax=Phanerochaete sordida TaxID=48140 RepID=A0A9P3LE83_9APHY|nr:hypothetical protein PsYK624_073770 [Phanerochaete sordida]
MDQESFRKLLQTPSSASAAATASRAGAPSAGRKKPKPKNADPAQPAFKPRTVKKLDQYRDRAGERRQGLAHDYAQVEALAEDFEKRNADKDPETLEEQRKYLGGDSEHTVLVKGLDFALLEQNKARLATESTVDDDVLEQAFAEGSSQAPKKRSRADILSALKNKRQKSEEQPDAATPDAPLDDAKKTGKFKPIGFKPIGGDKPKKKKARDGDADGAPKKKRKKLADGTSAPAVQPPPPSTDHTPVPSNLAPAPATCATLASKRDPPPAPAPEDEDDDIFAGAGDYAGIEVDEDDDEDDAGDARPREERDASDGEITDAAPRRWVDIDDGPVFPPKSASPPAPAEGSPARIQADASQPEGMREEDEEEQPARLQPLASSAVPSIRELLAADEAQEREAKRRARREKKKGKKGAGDESE